MKKLFPNTLLYYPTLSNSFEHPSYSYAKTTAYTVGANKKMVTQKKKLLHTQKLLNVL